MSIEQQLSHNTSLRVAYVGSFASHEFLSIDPNSIPAQICSTAAACTSGGTPGTATGTVPQGAQYIPVQSRPNPSLSGGFFWLTEGNSSYNALASGRHAPLEQRPAIPRKLYLVKKSGYQFRR